MGLIGIVALIVIGPERLPKVAATVGFWVGKLRAQAFNIRAEIEKEINADELREALHRQEEEMRNLHVMMQEAREKAIELEKEVHGELDPTQPVQDSATVKEEDGEMRPMIHPEALALMEAEAAKQKDAALNQNTDSDNASDSQQTTSPDEPARPKD